MTHALRELTRPNIGPNAASASATPCREVTKGPRTGRAIRTANPAPAGPVRGTRRRDVRAVPKSVDPEARPAPAWHVFCVGINWAGDCGDAIAH
jgi:hypothetical protein